MPKERELLFYTPANSFWIEGNKYIQRHDLTCEEKVVPFYRVKEALPYSDIDIIILTKTINLYQERMGIAI